MKLPKPETQILAAKTVKVLILKKLVKSIFFLFGKHSSKQPVFIVDYYLDIFFTY